MLVRSMKNLFLYLTSLAFLVTPALAKQVQLEAALANPLLKSGQTNKTFLKVGLTGFALEADQERTPVNVALVIDRSTSMSGGKIAQARDAARLAVQRLGAEDIVSIVAYDNSVEILVPATKLTDKTPVLKAIEKLEPTGNTALFAGVSKGADELRKFFSKEKVNRVLLLSDGQANVGPRSPGELGELGASLVKEGISVSTIGLGLGYNEDLMANLASKSDGNHVFVENEVDLVAAFDREFGDILSIVAQEVVVTMDFLPGVKPLRVIGREADIAGQQVTTMMNQLYSEQEKYVVVEVEVESGKVDETRRVADVAVSYANLATLTPDRLTSELSVRFSDQAEVVEAQANAPVMAACVLLVATENNEQAMQLRDKGDIAGAKQALFDNAAYLESSAHKWDSSALKDYGFSNLSQSAAIDSPDWSATRKRMIELQIENNRQIGHGSGFVFPIDNQKKTK